MIEDTRVPVEELIAELDQEDCVEPDESEVQRP